MTLTTGQVLQNRYRVASLLGQGGMGAVYHAWDTRLNVPIALKEMAPQPDLDPHTLAQLRQQFQQEAMILARLDHPHLVDVTDFFEEGGSGYLVMKFIEGESLAERIERQGALPERDVLAWGNQLLEALAYCHDQGMIHRDVKPQNVIIRPDGRAVLVDFGLVKLWDPGDPRTKTAMRGMGTPEYAPPEQYDMDVGHTDVRSDVYGLGATLYHALTGQAPPTATQRIASRSAFLPPRMLNQRISPATEAAVLRAMELTVEDRFPTAREMAAVLGGGTAATRQAVAKRRPTSLMAGAQAAVVPRKRVPVWAWAVGGLALLTLVAGIAMGARSLIGGGSMPTPTPSPTPTATPTHAPAHTPTTPTHTPAPTPLATATPQPTSRPTSTPAHMPTPATTATLQPSPTATSTSIPPTSTRGVMPTPSPAPLGTSPELAAPAQGGEYQSPVTFQWRGSLSTGQAYQVSARHPGSGYTIQSGLLTDQSWTADLPGDRFGEWRWTVSVVQGGRTAATSSEWMFWFNPHPGGGGGGGGEQPQTTNTPPP